MKTLQLLILALFTACGARASSETKAALSDPLQLQKSSWSGDTKRLAILINKKTIVVTEPAKHNFLSLHTFDHTITALALNHDGTELAVATQSKDNHKRMIHFCTAKGIRSAAHSTMHDIRAISYVTQSELFLGVGNEIIQLNSITYKRRSVASLAPLCKPDSEYITYWPSTIVAFDPHAKYCATHDVAYDTEENEHAFIAVRLCAAPDKPLQKIHCPFGFPPMLVFDNEGTLYAITGTKIQILTL